MRVLESRATRLCGVKREQLQVAWGGSWFVCFRGHHCVTRWDEWVMWHAWRQVRRTGTQFQSENHGESDNFVDLGVD
jgi:hypothetical protein